MDDGSDNQEDMQELESRLYSQVFHGSPLTEDNCKELSDHVTVNAAPNDIKNRLPRKRYWTQSKNDKDENQKPYFEKNKNFRDKFNKNKNNAIPATETSTGTTNVELNKESSTFLKPFEPYEPLFLQSTLNHIKSENGKFNLNATNKKASKVHNQKKKSLITSEKFQNNINQKILENQKKKRLVNQNWQISQSENHHHKNKLTAANQAKQHKIESLQKINEKKAKSQCVREKYNKNKQLSKAEEVIILEDSENDGDDDDVICIPAPPPPLIAVDNSDDEENKNDNKDSPQTKLNENVSISDKAKIKFTKPKTRKSNLGSASSMQCTTQSNNSSRCTSPSSTFSNDDFISVGEKSRLLEVCNVDDDDLTITETVDSFVQRKDKSRKTNDNLSDKTKTLNMPPPTVVEKVKPQQVNKKKQKNVATDYLVKENTFRAVDVYDESESDFSVYSKGSASNKNEVLKENEAVLSPSTSSSISDIDQIEIIQKVKRLRKRRASSNRESSDKKSSGESESENEINKTSTGLPYITKGEAVEKVRKRRKSSQINSSVLPVQQMNSSDNEFVLELNKIVQKNKIDTKNISLNNTSNDSNCSDELGENITARAIAEDVLNKSQQSKKQKNKDKTDNIQLVSENTEIKLIDVVSKEEFYISNLAESTPKKTPVSEQILKKAFEEVEEINVSVDICREKSPEMDSLDITQSDIEGENDESFVKDTSMAYEEILESNKIEVNGVTYYRIDSHSTDQIGWSEEMYRFYNMSWGGENFTVKGIKQSLDRKSNWNINSNDRYPKFTKHAKMKCFNCCEFGHISAKCPKPRKPLVCYMCGEQGHREPRCPNTICLKCGLRTPTFTKGCKKCSFQNKLFCYICKLNGHTSNLCPDKWRRYHSTVTPNTDPNNRVKYKNIKFCCVCAGRGHLPEQCKYAKIYLEYQPSLTQIKSHISTVAKQPNSTILSNSTITYNLLYRPNNNVQFSFSLNKEFNNNDYYSRFLTACKLNHLFQNQFENSLSNRENNIISNPERALKKVKKNVNKTNKESLTEHQFKLPNMVVEKSNSEIENREEKNKENKSISSHAIESSKNLNKTEDESTKIEQTASSVSKELVFDSDSNYSFSDHFDISKTTDDNNSTKCTDKLKELDLSTPQRKSRPMGELPDFIPLTGSDKYKKVNKSNEVAISEENNQEDENLIRFSDDIFKMPDLNFDNNDNEFIEDYGDHPIQGISHKLRNISESDIDESEYPDIPCVGKIFLPKNFSDYLLSPNGNKFLIENANKYNIKASIDWTSVGNVLVLEGFKDKQNKFHIQLMLELRALPKKLKNDLLEKSLRVPRKRSVLIKFLQDDLERLDQRIGNVYDLFKQLQMYEYQHSKNGLRQAQRIRTKLNMILLGQAGLRDGNKNLENLLKHLIQLQKDFKNFNYNQKNNTDTDNVTQNQRNEIDKSWKYIFSPIEHKNYNELIDMYYKLKRNNNLPILKIRDRINNGNIQFSINTSFNSFLNQKQNQLNQMTTNFNIKLEEETSNTLKRKEQFTSELDQLANIKIPKLFFNITDSNLTTASTSSTSFYDNERQQQQQQNKNINIDNVNNNNTSSQIDFLNKINGILDEIVIKEKNLSLSAEVASLFWSKESLKFLNEILKSQNWNVFIKKKIQQALNYATNGMLSHSDYRKIILLKQVIDLQNKF